MPTTCYESYHFTQISTHITGSSDLYLTIQESLNYCIQGFFRPIIFFPVFTHLTNFAPSKICARWLCSKKEKFAQFKICPLVMGRDGVGVKKGKNETGMIFTPVVQGFTILFLQFL